MFALASSREAARGEGRKSRLERARSTWGRGRGRGGSGGKRREAAARGEWETTSSSGPRAPNDPRDRARVAFGPFDSKPRAELSVDAQFGSARPARRKGVIPYVWAYRACVYRRTILRIRRRCYLLKILGRIKLVTRGVVLPDWPQPEDDTYAGEIKGSRSDQRYTLSP